MTSESEIAPVKRAALLTARGLAAAPPGIAEPVVRNVFLDLLPGDWLAVTGPNGSGKTTLALALATLWPPRSGTLEIAGGPNPPLAPARIVTLLQEPSTQITQRTVRDEIGFAAINLGASSADAWRAATRWAARLDLEAALERPPHELSAGEQQRVLLAGALAAEPDLLIADEAIAHLDRGARQRALALLHECVEAGLALVWVTQEPSDLPWANRVLDVFPGGECSERTLSARTAGGGAALGAGTEAVISTGAIDSGPTRVRVQILHGVAAARVQSPVDTVIDIGSRGVWAVSGPNGSGKSSLFEALAGVELLPEVVITWEGVSQPGPILAGQYPERQIFEERVRDEIAFAAVRRGRSRAEVMNAALALIESFGFSPELLDRKTWSLSAGEKRLVSLFGALLAPAALVLLDEPTCGVDSSRRVQLARCVVAYSAQTPVLVASQDSAWIRAVGAIEVALGEYDGPPGGDWTKNAK